MNTSLGTTPAKELMITSIVTVSDEDKISDVAKVFEVSDINSAPVLNKQGECVGIITSHDLVEYEAVRKEVCKEMDHGILFDQARYGDRNAARIPGRRFDEAGFHMSRILKTADPDDPLSRVARTMCQQHVHHILIMDQEKKLLGMLSSLDLLGFLLNEPVHKS